ncbi:elongation factor Ts, mitochondrial [Trichuris trichiura]|uniref:Elongation factor Ts, mitochondrial n=1 Tax=Trichuris trichiura TaxID=36087 RepID=A0A077ZC95_TRITR|nr:elongation factor Ts, mitochondrial [Trichuris trichiura]
MKWLPLGIFLARSCSDLAVRSGNKDLLLKLRRKTNYSYVNCRRALEKFDYNVDQAEKWLNEMAIREGWQKAAKLASRRASQGLIGISLEDGAGALVEVNCETDFVARTSNFCLLVTAIARACRATVIGNQPTLHQSLCKKIQVPLNELSTAIVEHDGKSSRLDDLIALSTATFGEKVCLKRCTCLLTSNDMFLSGYVHPKPSNSDGPMVGHYGAIIAYKNCGGSSKELDYFDIGQKICQHVVGMNPKSIGTSSEDVEEIATVSTEAEVAKPSEDKEKEEEDDELLSDRTELNNATELLRQTFLLDPTQTVGQFLKTNDCEIFDFVRFSLDEELKEDEK